MKNLSSLYSLLLSVVLLTSTSSLEAAINPDRTRLIYNADDKSTAITLTNESPDLPYLAQSWIENPQGENASDLLIALPPLQRIEAGEKSQVRIVKGQRSASLPGDRESLFYFNVREVPPKSSKKNVMQVAIQSRLKLFYRPANLRRDGQNREEEQMVVTRMPGKVQLANPTPWFITLLAIKNADGKTVKNIDGEMIAPFSDLTTTLENVALGDRFSVSFINDFGGVVSMRYLCQGNTCRFDNNKRG